MPCRMLRRDFKITFDPKGLPIRPTLGSQNPYTHACCRRPCSMPKVSLKSKMENNLKFGRQIFYEA